MIVSNLAVRNRVTVGVLTFMIAAFGVYAYVTLPRESFPDIPVPFILVRTAYEGVAPADIETSITMKIEKELAGLKGVKEIRSSSAEGLSTITIEFLPSVRTDDAMQYVRDRIDRAKGELPEDAEDTTITEISFSEIPILIVNISGDISPTVLKLIADRFEDVVEAIPGVLGCDVLGALEREIRLEVCQDRLAAYGLTLPEILSVVPSENVNISAGGLETEGTKFNVRVPAEFVQPEEVDSLVIAVRDGKPIYLTEVATVRDTFKDRVSYSRLGTPVRTHGDPNAPPDAIEFKPTITVTIQKRTGENILFIAEAVKRVIAEFEKQVPAGVQFDVTLDFSKDIRNMIADLENNLAAGMILVVAVLLIFMGWRPSFVVATEIPLSFLLSFIVLQLMGVTLNMMVLFSLIMACGMVVDNAIVIVENIYRHYSQGGTRVEAAERATAEVAWPVITSTLTTVAAFAPMIFWPGIMGGFMKWLPITLIVTLLSSLFVALVINPVLSAMIVTRAKFNIQDSAFMRGYRALLRTAFEHRFTTLSLALLALVGLLVLYGKMAHGVELFPEMDPRRAFVNIRYPQGTNIREVDALARLIEQRIQPFAAHFDRVITNVGAGAGGGGDPFAAGGGEHLADLTLVFHDYDKRTRPSAEIVAEIRAAIADIPGAELKVEKEKDGPPTGAAVTVRLIGEDFKELERLSAEAKALIGDVPNLVNLRSSHEAARPELAFRVDRQRAMLLGVNTRIVGNFLKTAVFGSEVGKYRQFNDEYDITVRLPVEQRQDIDQLFRLRVPNNTGQAVPLSSLGEFTYTGGYGTISRINQKRVITLEADAEGRLSTEVLADVQAKLAGLELPLGYEIRYAGEKEEQDKATSFLTRAFFVALLLIVLIIVMQFNTLMVPLIIMTTVILSLIGVFAGLLVHAMPFGIIMTGIGVISLAGVVVNNAIVLLDYTIQLRQRGMSLIEACVEAGATRFRPVLLTAGTTILGLVPMAAGVSYDFHTWTWSFRSESSQWWASMAIAVIYGLAFATLLTLVVVPTLYVSLTRLRERIGGWLGRPAGARAEPVVE